MKRKRGIKNSSPLAKLENWRFERRKLSPFFLGAISRNLRRSYPPSFPSSSLFSASSHLTLVDKKSEKNSLERVFFLIRTKFFKSCAANWDEKGDIADEMWTFSTRSCDGEIRSSSQTGLAASKGRQEERALMSKTCFWTDPPFYLIDFDDDGEMLSLPLPSTSVNFRGPLLLIYLLAVVPIITDGKRKYKEKCQTFHSAADKKKWGLLSSSQYVRTYAVHIYERHHFFAFSRSRFLRRHKSRHIKLCPLLIFSLFFSFIRRRNGKSRHARWFQPFFSFGSLCLSLGFRFRGI